jgi:pimeloyl-ACP methyl ester carboxylesterase
MQSTIRNLIACAAVIASGAGSVLSQTTVDVSFTARYDSSVQRYVAIFPPAFDSSVTHDVCIALHGMFSDRWQFATDTRDECRAARDAAAARDMLYISPDYRASSSCMNTPAETDVVQIIEELKARYRVGRVFVCGASMGGTSSLIFTILHPRLIAGVAAMNAKANMTEDSPYMQQIIDAYGGTSEQVPQEYYKRSAEFFPDSFMMPVGFTLSGKDDIVPPRSALRLIQELQDRGKKYLEVYEPDFGHSTNYADARAILDFVMDSASALPTGTRRSALNAPGTPAGVTILPSRVVFHGRHAGAPMHVRIFDLRGETVASLQGNGSVTWSVGLGRGPFAYRMIEGNEVSTGCLYDLAR